MQTTLGEYLLLFLMWAVGVLVLLLFSGLIGPKWLKEKMRRQVLWSWRDASLFMPMDPYKPIGQALKEGIDNFNPTKERFRNFLNLELGKLLLLVGIVSLVLILLYALTP